MTQPSRRTRFAATSISLALLTASFHASLTSAQGAEAPASPNPAAVCNVPQVSPTANFSGSVEFTNLANGRAQTVTYASGNDPIGRLSQYDKGFSIFKEYFVAWQDDAGNYYLPTQKISDAFPNGLTPGARLRAVWIGGMSIVSAVNQGHSITFNKDMVAADVLPDSSVLNSSTAHNVTAYYSASPDNAQLNLTSSFDFNRPIALATYHNPGGILTNSGQASDGTKKGARYSHVDLHIKFDPSVTLNDTLTFDFTSYQFKPSYVLDKEYNALAGNLEQNVQVDNPTTRITVSGLSGKNEFILRATIRHDGNPKNDITAPCVAALQQMALTSTSASNFQVSATEARRRSLDGTPIEVTGYIDGAARAAGFDVPIKRVDPVAPVLIRFTNNQVTFNKNSASLGEGSDQTISTGIIEHSKTIATNSFTTVENGIVWPADPQPLTINGTTYYFNGWNTKADGSGMPFTNQVAINTDTTVYAQWVANTPPTLTLKDTTITVDDELDLLTLVTSASDTEDARKGVAPTVTIEDNGGFTNKTPGTYTVKIKATDSAGAVTIATATVTVVAKPTPTVEPTTPAPTPEPSTPTPAPTPTTEPTGEPIPTASEPTAPAATTVPSQTPTAKSKQKLAYTGAYAPLGTMVIVFVAGGLLTVIRRRKNA